MAWACFGDGEASHVVDHMSQENRQDFSEGNLQYVTRSVNAQRSGHFYRTGQTPWVQEVVEVLEEDEVVVIEGEEEDHTPGDDSAAAVVAVTPAAGPQRGRDRQGSIWEYFRPVKKRRGSE